MKDLTLDELAEICKREMNSKDVEKLADGFVQDVCKLLEKLKMEIQQKRGLEKALAERQLSEAIRLTELLFSVRTTKAIILILTGRAPQNLVEIEREKFSEVNRLLAEIRRSLVSEEKITIKIPGACVRRLVVFRLGISQKIVGVDGKIYGPFDAGDIANLPAENAELVIKHRFAEEIHPS
ncbi:MAG: hypothetical protein QXX33_04890 [Candidatus Hadarchaeales archaeon]